MSASPSRHREQKGGRWYRGLGIPAIFCLRIITSELDRYRELKTVDGPDCKRQCITHRKGFARRSAGRAGQVRKVAARQVYWFPIKHAAGCSARTRTARGCRNLSPGSAFSMGAPVSRSDYASAYSRSLTSASPSELPAVSASPWTGPDKSA